MMLDALKVQMGNVLLIGGPVLMEENHENSLLVLDMVKGKLIWETAVTKSFHDVSSVFKLGGW